MSVVRSGAKRTPCELILVDLAEMRADNAQIGHHPAGMDEQDLIELLELQRLTRSLRRTPENRLRARADSYSVVERRAGEPAARPHEVTCCATAPSDHVHMRRVLCELREAVLEQVGKDQTDRLRHELADALTQYR